MEKEQQILTQAFNNLPKVIQDVIKDSNWRENLRIIVEKNNLHLDQGSVIEDETLLVMLGLETPQKYVENIIESANLDENTAYKIAIEVSDKIFKVIREKLINKTRNPEENKTDEDNLSTPPKPEPQTTPLQHQNETPFHDFDDELEQIKQKESVPISTPIQDLKQNPQTSTSPTTSQDNSTYQTSQTPHISDYDTKSDEINNEINDEINNDISNKSKAEPSQESTTEAPKPNQDPIVAAKLQNPVVSQEKQVDLKIDKNKLQQIKINPKPGEGMKVPTQMHNYNSSDPYREPVE